MPESLRSGLLAVLVFAALVTGLNAWRTRDVPPVAPAIDGVRIDGTVFSLAQFRAAHPGSPVALHVWATWCPVCRTEEHSISRLLRDPDIPVMTIATQSGDSSDITAVLRERGLDWPVVADPDGAILAALALPGVPSFIVIDADGGIRSAESGYTSEIGMRMRVWIARHTQ